MRPSSVIPGRQVVRRGAIQGKGQLGIEGIGRHPGPAQADFLLHGEGRQQVDIGRRLLHQLDQRSYAEAVIQGLGPQAGAKPGEASGKGRSIADACFAAVARADIDAQAFQGNLLA